MYHLNNKLIQTGRMRQTVITPPLFNNLCSVFELSFSNLLYNETNKKKQKKRKHNKKIIIPESLLEKQLGDEAPCGPVTSTSGSVL